MLLLIYCETGYVEYVSTTGFPLVAAANWEQTGVDCRELPADHRADLWTSTINNLIPYYLAVQVMGGCRAGRKFECTLLIRLALHVKRAATHGERSIISLQGCGSHIPASD